MVKCAEWCELKGLECWLVVPSDSQGEREVLLHRSRKLLLGLARRQRRCEITSTSAGSGVSTIM